MIAKLDSPTFAGTKEFFDLLRKVAKDIARP
jgi:hypothetical protein